MCRCTPGIRTPFCGRAGCEWPAPEARPPISEPAVEPHLWIRWQDGPVGEAGENGCQVDDVIDVVVARLERLNLPPFNCRENSLAITHLQEAQNWLERRTKNRQKRGVEGTRIP